MAKRKKQSKKSTSRRKVGALNANSPLVKYGSIAAGFFLGDKINGAIENAVGDKVDGKIIGGAELAAGLLLMFKKGKKSLPLTVVSGVLAGAGAKKSLQEFGVLNGFSDVPVISGYRSVPVLSGYTTRPGAMNGYNVPVPTNRVMGSVDDGSGINQSDR